MTDKLTYTPPVQRSVVEPKRSYAAYREPLRFDFFYSCAYCSITEVEAHGIGFQIDHYWPQKHFPQKGTKYTDLMWACQHCNRRKDQFYPTSRHQQEGFVIIRPDEDDPRKHVQVNGVRLEPLTPTGTFNIGQLDLNRLMLQRVRRIRQDLWESRAYIAHGVMELSRIGLDSLPPGQRAQFLQIRAALLKGYERAQEVSYDLVRDIAHSPLLDEDPNKAQQLRTRRAYLKEIEAITVDYTLPKNTSPKEKPSHKTPRKGTRTTRSRKR